MMPKRPWLAAVVALVLMVCVCAQETDEAGTRLVPPDQVPTDQRGYTLEDDYCWLLAHSSVLVGETIWVDGGISKFSIMLEGEEVVVPDFNGFTFALDLSTAFDVGSPPLTQYNKNPMDGTPVTNRGGLWANSTHLLSQGGHFYNAGIYNTSSYFVPKPAIPEYSIWAFPLDAKDPAWSQSEFTVSPEDAVVERTVAGAAACNESGERCWWLGGFTNGRTSKNTPVGEVHPSDDMLDFNTSTSILQNRTLGGYGDDGYAYAYGSLHHLPLGCEDTTDGLLLSLMSERMLKDKPSEVGESFSGEPNPMDEVMLYDVAANKWWAQKTPVPAEMKQRTRYCTALVKDEESGEWDMWLYGGISSTASSLSSLYILSLPTFTWTTLPLPPSSPRIRSATCHAHSSQLLILGGAPASTAADFSAATPCSNTTLIQLLDLNTLSWKESFSPTAAAYRRPQKIRDSVEAAKTEWADDSIKALFDETANCSKNAPAAKKKEGHPGLSKEQKIGIALGCLSGVLLVGALAWLIARACREEPRVVAEGAERAERAEGAEGAVQSGPLTAVELKELERQTRAVVEPEGVGASQRSEGPGSRPGGASTGSRFVEGVMPKD